MQVIGLAAGEPDFDTPAEIVAAGVEALQVCAVIGKVHTKSSLAKLS
jgi:aspartate/methionine/tyrosine aminotransferase